MFEKEKEFDYSSVISNMEDKILVMKAAKEVRDCVADLQVSTDNEDVKEYCGFVERMIDDDMVVMMDTLFTEVQNGNF